jgi:hypothetical protein
LRLGGEHARDRGEFAFLTKTNADDVERGDEIGGEGAIAGQLRAGSGARDAPLSACKHARRRHELLGIDPGARCCHDRWEFGDRVGERRQPADVRVREVPGRTAFR